MEAKAEVQAEVEAEAEIQAEVEAEAASARAIHNSHRQTNSASTARLRPRQV